MQCCAVDSGARQQRSQQPCALTSQWLLQPVQGTAACGDWPQRTAADKPCSAAVLCCAPSATPLACACRASAAAHCCCCCCVSLLQLVCVRGPLLTWESSGAAAAHPHTAAAEPQVPPRLLPAAHITVEGAEQQQSHQPAFTRTAAALQHAGWRQPSQQQQHCRTFAIFVTSALSSAAMSAPAAASLRMLAAMNCTASLQCDRGKSRTSICQSTHAPCCTCWCPADGDSVQLFSCLLVCAEDNSCTTRTRLLAGCPHSADAVAHARAVSAHT